MEATSSIAYCFAGILFCTWQRKYSISLYWGEWLFTTLNAWTHRWCISIKLPPYISLYCHAKLGVVSWYNNFLWRWAGGFKISRNIFRTMISVEYDWGVLILITTEIVIEMFLNHNSVVGETQAETTRPWVGAGHIATGNKPSMWLVTCAWLAAYVDRASVIISTNGKQTQFIYWPVPVILLTTTFQFHLAWIKDWNVFIWWKCTCI